MAYLSSNNYHEDVFISYAHADNESMFGAETGWVTNFIDDLKKMVTKKLGRIDDREFSIWFDAGLAKNVPLDLALTEKIENCALLIVILSPAYLASAWCKKERVGFLNLVRDKGKNSRVFLVEIDEINRKGYPAEFDSNLISYRFWKQDTGKEIEVFGMRSRQTDNYINSVMDIAQDIVAELQKIAGNVPGNNTPIVESTKGNIYLAQVTDDLDEKRNELKRYFKEMGYKVFPDDSWYPMGKIADLTAYIGNVMKDCTHFVQLLSGLSGKSIEETETGPSVQFNVAKRDNKQIFIWRAADVVVENVSNPRHRQMLSNEYVRAESIENFKSAIVASFKPPSPPPTADDSFVYICLDAVDEAHCGTGLFAELERNNIDYMSTKLSGENNTEKNQKWFLQNCDAAIFVYGNNSVDSILTRLRYCQKSKAGREKPFKAVSVFDGPPSEKNALDISISGLPFQYLNCREDMTALKSFIDTIRK